MEIKVFEFESLTKSERFLLDWLSKEDVSSLGECKGRDLDQLVAYGLARITLPTDSKHQDYGHVSLTATGIQAWRNMIAGV